LISSSQMYGQFGKQLGKRVTERVKETTARKVENKAEEKTEKILDDIFMIGGGKSGKDKNENNGESGQNGGFDMGGMMEDMMNGKEVEYRNSYTFAFMATIEVENFTEEHNLITMKQGYGKGSIYTEMDQPGANMIHDFDKESVVIIDHKNRTAQAMSLAWMQKMIEKIAKDNSGEDDQAELKKTGRTQKMNGYTCHEYHINYTDGKMIVWYAPGVKFDYSDYMGTFSKGLGRDMGNIPTDQGYIMSMEAFEASGAKSFRMEVIELSESPRTIDLSAYNVTKLF